MKLYELVFWKDGPGAPADDHEIYERLSHGQDVEGLEDLPVERMMGTVAGFFDGWRSVAEQAWEGPDGGVFQLFGTRQLFRADCYRMRGEDMNRIIDAALAFGCALYDPQVRRRFRAL